MRALALGLLVGVSACVAWVPADPFACDDSDGDGVCDAWDPCPDDPADDEDGDGVCEPDDVCHGGDDNLDADGDSVPDACDLCDGGVDLDSDGDGRCDATDPCPEDPENLCAESVWVGIQSDVFWRDIAWRVEAEDGTPLLEGAPTGPGGGQFETVEVDGRTRPCVVVTDSEGDGGARGLVFNPIRQLLIAEWTGSEYTDEQKMCFDPTQGTTFVPPKENVWINGGRCEVAVRIYTGLFPEELGWKLETREHREIAAVATGTFATVHRNENLTLVLTEGDYRFWQYDSVGDGWTEREDDASFEVVRVKDGGTVASGTLRSGFQGSITFLLDCQ